MIIEGMRYSSVTAAFVPVAVASEPEEQQASRAHRLTDAPEMAMCLSDFDGLTDDFDFEPLTARSGL